MANVQSNKSRRKKRGGARESSNRREERRATGIVRGSTDPRVLYAGTAWDETDRRRDEAELDKMRRRFGRPPHHPRFDVPLSRYAAARLMAADLDSEEGRADYLLGAGCVDDHSLPTLEQLRNARAIMSSLEEAIVNGDDPHVWHAVERGRAAMNFDSLRRRRVVEAIRDVVDQVTASREAMTSMREHLSELQRQKATVRAAAFEVRTRAFEADTFAGVVVMLRRKRRELIGLDQRFAALTAQDVRKIVSVKTIRALGIAGKLSMACGAFTDARQSHEEPNAWQKRVKGNYEKAMKTSCSVEAKRVEQRGA